MTETGASDESRIRFAWELFQAEPGDPIDLHLLPTSGYVPDDTAAVAIETARRLTEQRSGGWREARARSTHSGPFPDSTPVLPWHASLSPEQHAWVWMKLLKPYALNPDLAGPKLKRRGE